MWVLRSCATRTGGAVSGHREGAESSDQTALTDCRIKRIHNQSWWRQLSARSFRPALQRTSVQRKTGCLTGTRSKQPSIGPTRSLARQCFQASARYAAPAAGGHGKSGLGTACRTERILGSRPLQEEPDAGASAGDRAGDTERKIGIESDDTGRQALFPRKKSTRW